VFTFSAVVPEPLEVTSDLVNFEFIRMPDSTGFGDYTESGQVLLTIQTNRSYHHMYDPLRSIVEVVLLLDNILRSQVLLSGDIEIA
jgi:acetoacetate decarboxylase